MGSLHILVGALACVFLAAGHRGREHLHPPHSTLPQLNMSGGIQPSESLDNVKDMIRHMIDQKMAAMTDYVSWKQFCDNELPKAKDQVKNLGLRLERSTADRNRLEAEIAELGDVAADLRAEVVEAQQATSRKAETRSQEHAAYEEERQRYERGLVRKPLHLGASAAAPSGKDPIATRVKADTQEAAKDLSFRRTQHETSELIKQKGREAQQKQLAITMKQSQLSEVDSNRHLLVDRVANSKDYLAHVERQCIHQPEALAARRHRRDTAIASLKDAYTILGG